MADRLPIRKYIKVWVMRRKNNARKGGKPPTISYTLQWEVYGRKAVMSLGRGATLAYAKRMAAEKEKELNADTPSEPLEPISWGNFRKKYLDTFYPGHDLPPAERKKAQMKWGKSFNSMRSERLALDNFGRLIDPDWCHEITSAEREKFVTERLAEVPSAASVDADLRVLRSVFNVMEDWKHRPANNNPFAGRGKSSVGSRRRRQKQRMAKEDGTGERARHYSIEEVKAILAKATEEAKTFDSRRLRALVHFVAHTGCRINEAVHLEWQDID